MPSGRFSGSIDYTAIKFNWRGDWATSGIYSKNDIVRYNGRSYYCKTDQLFEQNLSGLEFGPGKINVNVDWSHVLANSAPVTWNSSNTANIFSSGLYSPGIAVNPISGAGLGYSTGYPTYVGSVQKANTGIAAWDSAVWSSESYANTFIATGQASLTSNVMFSNTYNQAANGLMAFGVTTRPTASVNPSNLVYGWWLQNGTAYIAENTSSPTITAGTYTPTTKFSIQCDGKYVRYYKDSVIIRQVDYNPAAYAGNTWFYQACINTPSNWTSNAVSQLVNMTFGSSVTNKYWAEHNEGYNYRGGWMHYRNYYPGDVVKMRGDLWICKRAGYNSHPIYKNGSFPSSNTAIVSDWAKVASGTHSNDDETVELLPNMPPLGWTRFRGSMMTNPGSINSAVGTRLHFVTASGKVHRNGSHLYDTYGWNMNLPRALVAWPFDDWRQGRLPGFAGSAPRCIQMVGNETMMYFLFDNGELYYQGTVNSHGEMGVGNATGTTGTVARVGFITGTNDYRGLGASGAGILANTRIIKVASSTYDMTNPGGGHTVALDANGGVWTWGYDGYGQLGQNQINANAVTDSYLPTLLEPRYFNNVPIVDIHAWGAAYGGTLAIDANGQMYTWGFGGNGQLGLGTTHNVLAPQAVEYDFNKFGGIKKLYVPSNTTAASIWVLTNDGTIHYTGYNGNGATAIPGQADLSYVMNFAPAINMLQGVQRALGQEARMQGFSTNVLKNCDDFWVIGNNPGNCAFVFKEKNTGVLYGMGNNGVNAAGQNNLGILSPNFTLATAGQSGGATVYTPASSPATQEMITPYIQYWPIVSAVPAPDLCHVFAGGNQNDAHSMYWVTENGKVYTTGYQYYGSLGTGLGSTDTTQTPYVDQVRTNSSEWDTVKNFPAAGQQNNAIAYGNLRIFTPMRQSEKISMMASFSREGYGAIGIGESGTLYAFGALNGTYISLGLTNYSTTVTNANQMTRAIY